MQAYLRTVRRASCLAEEWRQHALRLAQTRRVWRAGASNTGVFGIDDAPYPTDLRRSVPYTSKLNHGSLNEGHHSSRNLIELGRL